MLRTRRETRPVPHVLPEKTVELWTALAVQTKLHSWATVCSRPTDPDQFKWPPGLRQWFLLEPRAPQLVSTGEGDKPRSEVRFRIDRRQLDNYVEGYRKRKHPDVIYVLPDPRQRPLSERHRDGLPIVQREVWEDFSKWSFVVRSTVLQDLIQSGRGKGWAIVHVQGGQETGTILHRPHPTRPTKETKAPSLGEFLAQVLNGLEPPGVTLRSGELPALSMSRGSQDEHKDLTLSPEAIREAQHALSREHAGHLLIVGLPWYRADPLRRRT